MKRAISKIIFLALFLALCFYIVLFSPKSYCMTNKIEEAVNSLSDDLMKYIDLSEDRQVKIAFLPMSIDKHEQSYLARVIYETMRNKINEIKGISLVDKDLSLRIMGELKIVLKKGLMESDDVINLSKQTDIDYLITGHLADLNTIININIFIWNVNDGSLLSIKS
ncbi:MAG: FlgO family outer membrane protein, partial [Candidatus Poribacteria bacterium]